MKKWSSSLLEYTSSLDKPNPENDAYVWSHIPIFKGEILEPLPGGSCFPWNEVFWASMVASFGWPWLPPFGREGVTENDRDINTQLVQSNIWRKPVYLAVNTILSGNVSLKSIQWGLDFVWTFGWKVRFQLIIVCLTGTQNDPYSWTHR